jgi:hypothetical protein
MTSGTAIWVKNNASPFKNVCCLWSCQYDCLSVILPHIDEQIVIAEFFSSLDYLISAYEQELKKLQNIKKACLSKMFV